MTMVTIDSVGLCAHYSPTGDRAFRYALSMARGYGLRLNIFSFLQDPFEPHDPTWRSSSIPRETKQKLIIEADRRMRLYYEDRLGDYLDVGFKVCEEREEVELRRCILRREYQVLVVPYHEQGGSFGNLPIEEFATHFAAPVVLVGPWRRVRYYLNPPATLIADKLHLYEGTWRSLPPIDAGCNVR